MRPVLPRVRVLLPPPHVTLQPFQGDQSAHIQSWVGSGMWCDLGFKGWFWAWQRVRVHFCICLINMQFLLIKKVISEKDVMKRFLGDSVSSFNIHFQNVPCFNTIFLYFLEPAAVAKVATKGPLGNPRNCIPLCELLSRLGTRHLHLHPIGVHWVLKSAFHH